MPPPKGTFYEQLGVSPDAQVDDIRRACKKKCLETHPDKHPGEDPEEWAAAFRHVMDIQETLTNEQSRMVYDEKHLRRDRTNQILVLMDMNGSLLCKVGKRDCRGGLPVRADFEDRDNYFFLRPKVKEFLEAILSPGSNISFAIYTSRQTRNAMPQVQQFFQSAGCSGLQRRLFNIFAGDQYSVPDPASGPHKSKRSLPKIWRDPRTCAAVGVKFDECNTVDIDNEVSKLRDHPENGLVVPCYGIAELGRTDEALPSLQKYLLLLAKVAYGDVREYMRIFPFSMHEELQLRALPPVSHFEVDDEEEDDSADEFAAAVGGFSLTEPRREEHEEKEDGGVDELAAAIGGLSLTEPRRG